MQVNAKGGLTFARGLRSMLRADPDIIMVGEIRDAETARIAIESALTGHLVLSTLHTNDAPSAITRLTEMGIEPFLSASALDCIVAQRLVRTLCIHCRKRDHADPPGPRGRRVRQPRGGRGLSSPWAAAAAAAAATRAGAACTRSCACPRRSAR